MTDKKERRELTSFQRHRNIRDYPSVKEYQDYCCEQNNDGKRMGTCCMQLKAHHFLPSCQCGRYMSDRRVHQNGQG